MTLKEFKLTEMGQHIIKSSEVAAEHYVKFNLLYGPIDSVLWDIYSKLIPEGKRIRKGCYMKFVRFIRMEKDVYMRQTTKKVALKVVPGYIK